MPTPSGQTASVLRGNGKVPPVKRLLVYPICRPLTSALEDQGNRVLTEQDFEEVIFSPANPQAFALDSHFQG